ncbi:hypothetical protein Aau02nite_63340 [Amorphoplanes auranticolor]|uniref:Uncharacterized protein n=1 Tax=Actinoplanes auranticolor TaxID=47988 RepID=A0A919SLE9_9ACTN|nr:hypothetical protein Aau02nite_63340 [Actinoplanes auranticolor]
MPAPPPARPSDTYPMPDDVTDRLLYALAVDVATAHQPRPDGTCPNLQCHGRAGPCVPLLNAYRAADLARRPPGPPRPAPQHPARGHARVPASLPVNGFRELIAEPTAGPAPHAPAIAGPGQMARPFAVFRRPPAA